MGKAGKALRRVLTTYGVSQNQLAIAMGVPSGSISRWVNESRDPSAEAVVEIRKALEKIDPAASEEFVMLYLYDSDEGQAE